MMNTATMYNCKVHTRKFAACLCIEENEETVYRIMFSMKTLEKKNIKEFVLLLLQIPFEWDCLFVCLSDRKLSNRKPHNVRTAYTRTHNRIQRTAYSFHKFTFFYFFT